MQTMITLAEELARISGAIILRYYGTGFDVSGKADGSPVTIADREAEAAMRRAIQSAFPAHGILGEEYGNERLDATYVWTLDPIDGTKNFVAGSFLFSTLIGLLRDGVPVMGALHHPLTGHLLIGTPEETRLNGRRVQMRPCDRIEDALMLSSSYTTPARSSYGPAFEVLVDRARLYRTWGDGHGYFLLASGGADLMLDPIMAAWDLAPLIPIVQGAGGRITAWDGSPAWPDTATVLEHKASAVAATPALHAAVLAVLNADQADSKE
ncbi:MAG: histidinol-phosphatase [Anaerolineae bacterium]